MYRSTTRPGYRAERVPALFDGRRRSAGRGASTGADAVSAGRRHRCGTRYSHLDRHPTGFKWSLQLFKLSTILQLGVILVADNRAQR